MALTITRWIMLAVIACLMIPVLVFQELPDNDYTMTRRDSLQRKAAIAETRLRTAGERYYITRVADSLRRTVPQSPRAATTVAYDRAIPGETRQRLADLVSDALSDRPTTPLINVDVRFVLDSVSAEQRSERRGFAGAMALEYIPPRDSTGRCLVVARIHPRRSVELQSDVSRERLLGPCAFYQAFGKPGAAIERWLRNDGWQLAQMGQWQGAIRTWSDRWARDKDYPLRYAMGARGFQCAIGNASACVDAVLRPQMRSFKVGSGILSTADYNPFAQMGYWNSRNWSFGPRAPYLMADMVRDLGPQRFARFWRSDADLTTAFQSGAETDLATWTRRWLIRAYHAERAGPAISLAEGLWVLALLALTITASLQMARRRQMA